MRTALLAWLMASCATLNTAGMSETCKRLYDACLNTCPGARQADTMSRSSQDHMAAASCTADCNHKAKNCE